MSWRDSASQSCQDDLDRLLQQALPLAQQLLVKYGEFFPYGVVLANSGATRMIAAYDSSRYPPSTDLLRMLYDGLLDCR